MAGAGVGVMGAGLDDKSQGLADYDLCELVISVSLALGNRNCACYSCCCCQSYLLTAACICAVVAVAACWLSAN